MSPKKPPIVERTTSRGTVDLKFPGLEASFPATNRSIMVILIAGFIAIIILARENPAPSRRWTARGPLRRRPGHSRQP
jgi:hypothetical protein